MTPTTTHQGVYKFIDLVRYYRNMWDRLSHKLEPLKDLTPSKVNLKWTYVKQKQLEDIRRIFARNAELDYSYFNKQFDVNIYAIYLK